MSQESLASASSQDGRYPRPQLLRASWADLSGPWRFALDPDDRGVTDGWAGNPAEIAGEIIVPFPPESPASGIGDTGYQRVLWYRRTVAAAEVAEAGHDGGRTLLLHFGAVDYRADVWIDGAHVGAHEGGHTPFTVVVPQSAADGFDLVVRAEDDPQDLAQPRGKQDWEERRHVVWYDRTSGIWQPVWLESVPARYVQALTWRTDPDAAVVHLSVELDGRPAAGTRLSVRIARGEETLAAHVAELTEPHQTLTLSLPVLRNSQARDAWLWTPEHPLLLDAVVELLPPNGESDRIGSYLGIRSVGTGGGRVLVNDRPTAVRAVLSQGYWPQSHLAAPDADALRHEAQLIKDLGFTSVRVHQKVEDPRFLYWTDRLGLLVWAEMPSVYEFSALAAERLVREWAAVVRRDSSHPSIVVWVPLNESWGVDRIAQNGEERELARSLYHLTKALDSSRLVVSNDGWEHTRSDLFTVHDYENDAAVLRARYGTPEAVRQTLDGIAPNGRRMLVGSPEESADTAGRPVLLSEFGGVSVDRAADGTWGYRTVSSDEALETHLSTLFSAVGDCAPLAGWCYTQLTDTAQETNGLTDENRVPKIPLGRLRRMIADDDGIPAAAPVFHAEPSR
ncbi:beta-galactosidase/beta-glucuronidase [Microbacterium natoriense]|uniref:Beta-galactosidase/beta-glucuronidase n=1 Tax=Microbacterium natoriense TaxID=284570 RepID=A0AAW8ETP3_9MICO|nr:glycoside hydrolase family 2 TIM barrel-domain containing protein [Microbacterium natoriense]MDQ0646686.1 beta-galactosidase/beta-glucuronidase [Microbacterium natoriense]